MRLHTSYLDHLRIAPGRNADGVEFVRAFNSTRHCGDDDAPLRTAEHPADNEPTGDVTAYNRVAPGLPGLWCPWTCCSTGCCRHWNGVEKPSAQSAWLSYLSDTFLRPGAALADLCWADLAEPRGSAPGYRRPVVVVVVVVRPVQPQPHPHGRRGSRDDQCSGSRGSWEPAVDHRGVGAGPQLHGQRQRPADTGQA